MKLIVYDCPKCEKKIEELFNDLEEIPEEIECPVCKEKAKKGWNVKSNSQVAKVTGY